ncbi:MAG: hypothetical protein KDC37_04015, partial [Flavobacteriales bacterium]|nr:hypothetical protein [Flavobacteriales bacterium]
VTALHAFFPFHWLPLIAAGTGYNKDKRKVDALVIKGGVLHILSTLIVGIGVAWMGNNYTEVLEKAMKYLLPLTLLLLGVYSFFHFNHKHEGTKRKNIETGLLISMVLMPCLEIEPLFLLGGSMGWDVVLFISVIYVVTTASGMVAWMWLLRRGVIEKQWRKREGIAGQIVGSVLIASAIAIFFLEG